MTEVSSISGTQAVKLPTSGRNIDSYAVFDAHIEAIGGEYNVKNDKNLYTEGQFSVSGSTYNYEEWTMKPGKSKLFLRDEKDEIFFASGDDGSNIWSLSKNNLNSMNDSGTIARKISEAYENRNYMDPENTDFNVEKAKVVSVGGKKAYEIKITNDENDTIYFNYIDTRNNMLIKERKVSGSYETETLYSNYRDVGGVMKAYNKQIKNIKTGVSQEFTVKTINRNILMNTDLFLAPERDTDGIYQLEEKVEKWKPY